MTEFATRQRAVQKRKLFEELLGQGIAALHLDPRAAGVQLPRYLKDQPVLVLNYSYRYGVGDFRFDDKVVEATLSFSKQPSFCIVPWSAVFAVTTDARTQGSVWQEDLPEELGHRELAGGPPGEDAPARPKPSLATARKVRSASAKPSRAKPVAAEPARAEAAAAAQSADDSLPSKPARPGLRLVAAAPADSAAATGVPAAAPAAVDQAADAADDPPPRPPAGGHLRRIK